MSHRVSQIVLMLSIVLLGGGCVGTVSGADDGGMRDDAATDGARVDADRDAAPEIPPPGLTTFTDEVQPALVEHCSPCHVGHRFAFASLERAGATFTADETRRNYDAFLQTISLDAPEESRLLQKGRGLANGGISHAGGSLLTEADATYATLHDWIEEERLDRCPDCGVASPTQFIAYVEQPRSFWALDADPQVLNFGDRTRSRIRIQPVDPGTLAPRGAAFDFLPDSFCGPDGRCDFQNLAVSHAGDRMVFECRLSLEGEDFHHNVRWNLCIAEIGADGRASNPRFLLPAEQRHHGRVIARTDPFGLTHPDGWPLQGEYDVHYLVRRRGDHGPTFSPDDSRIYYSSRGPTPHDGLETYQTYHGFDVLDHILAVQPDGTDRRTIYQNEGGLAELPFFLHDGTLAFHTWNLERMDRHMYTRVEPDGVSEVPILGGNVQGPNMWGRAVQLANGIVVGITGRRRSSIENYSPFALDHTLGVGLEPELGGFRMLDPTQFEDILDFPIGYCEADAPDGPSCAMDRFYADPSFAPDGRALLAYTPEHVHVPIGYDMQKFYPRSGSTPEEVVASLDPYLPRQLGVALMDENGIVTPLLPPADGTMMRFPVWIGRRAPERVIPWRTDDSVSTVDLHIADVPLWMSFRDARGREHASDQDDLDRIVSLRVLVKESERTSCLSDALPYRYNVLGPMGDHPTFLGINNASGFSRLVVPESAGGDAWGDVPLESDRSVHVRVPARRLLLVQGIDANGSVVRQHARVFALPGGHDLDASVTRAAYPSQCGTCHGNVDHADTFHGLTEVGTIPRVPHTFDTEARSQPIVDLTGPGTEARLATFLHRVRPLFDRSCVPCHSGATPAGELSLSATYSPTGNYPAGRWATEPDASPPGYLAFVPPADRVPAYDYSVSWAWFFQREDAPYRASPDFAPLISSYAPLADLAPWDPAYQNLFAPNGIDRLRYLGGFRNSNFGRSDRQGGNSRDSWLVEILTGRDVDPTLTFTGPDHTGYLSEAEVRELMGVIDLGFPYMAHCDDRTVPSGPNVGEPWGDVAITQFDDATR